MDLYADVVARDLFKVLEEIDPAQWRKCYPRHYTETSRGKFASPEAPSREMMGVAKKVEPGFPGASEKVECVWASQLSANKVPPTS
jgi:hypothetical protein